MNVASLLRLPVLCLLFFFRRQKMSKSAASSGLRQLVSLFWPHDVARQVFSCIAQPFRSFRSFRGQIALAIMTLTLAPFNTRAQAAEGREEFSISGDLFVPIKDTPETTRLASLDISRDFTGRIQVGVGSTFNFFGDTAFEYANGDGSGDCVAVLYGDTGRVSAYGYGAGWNAATVKDAISAAHAEMDKRGVAYGDPQKYQGVVFQGCGVSHGAVAGVRDDQIPNDHDIVVLTLAFGKGQSESDAASNALASCRELPNSRGRSCEVLQSW